MSQSPFNDLAGRLNKTPKGVGIGLKLLAFGGAALYGVNQSMYTGNELKIEVFFVYSLIFF